MYVWPSAVVLAQYVWTHRGALVDKTVLEVGLFQYLSSSLAINERLNRESTALHEIYIKK